MELRIENQRSHFAFFTRSCLKVISSEITDFVDKKDVYFIILLFHLIQRNGEACNSEYFEKPTFSAKISQRRGVRINAWMSRKRTDLNTVNYRTLEL